MLDVAIVGAGVAGIAAAESCVSNGLTYVVLEAASESGGRCASRYLTDGTILDLGAHWLHSPPDNPLMQLATEHGVVFATRPLQEIRFNGSRMLSEQQVVDMDLCLESAFDAMSRDLHLSADGYSNLAGSWQDAFRTVFEIKQGRPPAMVSGLDFSRYRWIEDDLPVRGGMQTLLAALSRGKDIRTNHKVSSIDCTSADHVQLSGEFGTLSARRAVVTCSTGVIASKQIKFTPRLPDEMELAIETLPMGSCNKIFLGFKTSSWISGLKDLHILPLGRNGESVEITAFEYGAPFVTGMIHGDFGKSLAAAGEVAMREYILDVLVSLLGSNVRHDFNGYQTCVDWDSNPLIRGYVAAAVPGYANSRAVLRKVWLERVRIAGEATSPHFMGDAHGAWLEGKKAVLDLV